MNLRAACFFLLLLGSFSRALGQGPISGFMPRPRQLDVAYTYSQEKYDQFFNADGDLLDRRLSARSSNLFLEYGADAKTALVATASYLDHDQLNKGWQDASLWLKYRNERTEHPLGFHNLITAVGLSFPLSSYPNDNPAAIGRRAATFHGRFLWQYEARYGWFVHPGAGRHWYGPLLRRCLGRTLPVFEQQCRQRQPRRRHRQYLDPHGRYFLRTHHALFWRFPGWCLHFGRPEYWEGYPLECGGRVPAWRQII
jgi:hypothetical protein